MAERSAVNRKVVGSIPTGSVYWEYSVFSVDNNLPKNINIDSL